MNLISIIHKLKKLRVAVKIFLVFIIPMVLALPFPPPPFNIEKIKTKLQNGEPVKQEKFRFLTDNKALGASLLSTILDIKTEAMRGFVCISNVSEIYAEGQRKEKTDLIEDAEGGALSIPLFFDDTITQIYIPFASTTCVSPQAKAGFAELENKVEVRGFLPLGRAELTTIHGEPAITVKQYADLVTVFRMEGKKGYEWKWAVFWKNYALFLIGWIILLSSIIQVFQWIRRKSG